MSPRDKLAMMLAPPVLAILDEYVRERVREELDVHAATAGGRPHWVPVVEAARLEGCSVEAMRMRLARGRYETKHVGRNVLVSTKSLEASEAARR